MNNSFSLSLSLSQSQSQSQCLSLFLKADSLTVLRLLRLPVSQTEGNFRLYSTQIMNQSRTTRELLVGYQATTTTTTVVVEKRELKYKAPFKFKSRNRGARERVKARLVGGSSWRASEAVQRCLIGALTANSWAFFAFPVAVLNIFRLSR